MAQVFIGVGSNEGDRLENISRAVDWIGSTSGNKLIQMATILETEPIGGPKQDSYLNTVIELDTNLSPFELLGMLKHIEVSLGRVKNEHWGPRPIDLDILIYGLTILDEPDLTIPHPRMHEREFVLTPLNQIAPDLIHPSMNKSTSVLLNELSVDKKISCKHKSGNARSQIG